MYSLGMLGQCSETSDCFLLAGALFPAGLMTGGGARCSGRVTCFCTDLSTKCRLRFHEEDMRVQVLG